MKIIGIDPGSRVTGYGIVDSRGSELGFITCGTLQLYSEPDFSLRLGLIFSGLQDVIDRHQPEMAAVESCFVATNIGSALKLGQARGAAVAALCAAGIRVYDYSPRTVKQSVTGYGQADKLQMQEMVKRLLELDGLPSADAADGLALAICHANHSFLSGRKIS